MKNPEYSNGRRGQCWQGEWRTMGSLPGLQQIKEKQVCEPRRVVTRPVTLGWGGTHNWGASEILKDYLFTCLRPKACNCSDPEGFLEAGMILCAMWHYSETWNLALSDQDRLQGPHSQGSQSTGDDLCWVCHLDANQMLTEMCCLYIKLSSVFPTVEVGIHLLHNTLHSLQTR